MTPLACSWLLHAWLSLLLTNTAYKPSALPTSALMAGCSQITVTTSEEGSQIYCPPNGGCNFLTVQPAGYVVNELQGDPRAVARFSTLRNAFFTEQLLTAIPFIPGTPSTMDFRNQQPSVSVSLSDVNITCGSLVVHQLLTDLPIPITPDQQLVAVASDADLVDAITCAHPFTAVA